MKLLTILTLSLSQLSIAGADPEAVARPDALPAPAPEPLPLPEAHAEAEAIALAEPEAEADPQQTYTGTFSGAFQITTSGGSQGSPAVPAQCPAQYPTGCSSIGASGWCCSSGTYCAWNSGSVGCCPSGQTCNSYASGAGAGYNTWTSTHNSWNTWTQPSSTYVPPASTVVVAPVGQVTVTQAAPQQYTTTQQRGGGGFCSTIYETGPNLPTQAQGQCGTILIAKADAVEGAVVDMSVAAGAVLGGAVLFAWTLIT